jgi:hypothetical protein
VFISRIIQPGRIFLRRLFTASTKVRLLFHRVRLTSEATKDIAWWLSFIRVWNGKSMFLDEMWTSSSVLSLASDASNAGMGAVFGNSWWLIPFDNEHLAFPIAWQKALRSISVMQGVGPQTVLKTPSDSMRQRGYCLLCQQWHVQKSQDHLPHKGLVLHVRLLSLRYPPAARGRSTQRRA